MLKKGLMSPCAQAQTGWSLGFAPRYIPHSSLHLSLVALTLFLFCPSAFPLLWLMLRPLSSPLLACLLACLRVCVLSCEVEKKNFFLRCIFACVYSTPKLFLSSLGVLGTHWFGSQVQLSRYNILPLLSICLALLLVLVGGAKPTLFFCQPCGTWTGLWKVQDLATT
jgi:hypothetical protein